MTALMALPVVAPLIGAAVTLLFGGSRVAQRALSVLTLAAVAAVSFVLLADVADHGPRILTIGGWDTRIGISLLTDAVSVLMVTASAVVMAAVAVFAVGHRLAEADNRYFYPLYLVLAAGINASLLTMDLFNLFVAFEMMLMASYALITLEGTRPQVLRGMSYITINLMSSTLFLLTLALVYGTTGTVNMAELSARLPELSSTTHGAIGLLLLAVFGVKSAVFPMFFWLPDSYSAAPSPIAAVFAGLLTKVGVYTILRSQTLLFADLEWLRDTLMVLAGLTMVIGVLGAIAQYGLRRLLSFHIISQIGYILMGIALFTAAGFAAAIYFVLHQMTVKTALFMVSGAVERKYHHDDLQRLSGLLRREPVLGVVFGLAAASLAGIPPFSGFIGKLALVQAGFSADAYVIVAISLAVSLCTLYSMVKIWSHAFWGPPPPEPDAQPTAGGAVAVSRITTGQWAAMVGSTALLVAASMALAFGAEPILNLLETETLR